MYDFDPSEIDAESFWSRVQRGDPDECWPWTGRKNSPRWPYGELTHHGRILRAHRVAHAIDRGSAIPRGLFVLHACDNPPCCNPRHLQAGTQAENGAHMRERQRCGPYAPCGTRSAYVRGCRCDECRTANSIYQRDWSRQARAKKA